jgi:hypothetical protein
MADEQSTAKAEKPELPFEQLKLYLELYKHHSDLFLKGMALYLAIAGTLGGFYFSDRVNMQTKRYIAFGVTVGSVVAFAGCIISHRWLKAIDSHMAHLSSLCGFEQIPLFGPKGILVIMLLISLLLVIGGVLAMILA